MNKDDIPSLSDESLLCLLQHPLGCDGKGGVLGPTTYQRLVWFLSLDCKYNYPSIIEREINHAVEKGFINIDKETIVNFTPAGIAKMKELDIYNFDGVRKEIKKANDLRKIGANAAADELMEKSGARYIWSPPEWDQHKIIKAKERPASKGKIERRKSVAVADDAGTKLDKLPPIPRRLS